MKRRDFIAIGVAGGLLASCKSLGLPGSGNTKQAQHDLEVWWSEGYYPEETDAIETIFANWQHSTGNKVNLTFFSENELAAKARSAIDGGPTPDLLYGYGINDTVVPVLSYNDKLVALEEVVKPIKADLLPGVLDGVTYLNKRTNIKSVYAVPISQHSVNLHYWKDLVEEAFGGTDKKTRIPHQWKEFWDFWQTCQRSLRQKGYDEIYGMALPMSNLARDTSYIFEFFLEAHDAKIVTQAGKLNVEDAGTRQRIINAINDYTSNYKKKYVPPKATSWADPDNNINFLSSLSVMTANPTLSIPGSQLSDEIAYFERLGSLPWPNKVDGSPMQSFISVKQAIVFNSSNVDKAKDLLAYVLKTENLSRYVEGSQGRFLPTTKSIMAMPFWHNTKDIHITTAIQNMKASKVPAWILNPAYSEVIAKNVWGEAIEAVATNTSSTEKAVDAAITEIRTIFAGWN
jgi:multiple sugar transport system substrate-binding protein